MEHVGHFSTPNAKVAMLVRNFAHISEEPIASLSHLLIFYTLRTRFEYKGHIFMAYGFALILGISDAFLSLMAFLGYFKQDMSKMRQHITICIHDAHRNFLCKQN